jgi:hypothetical protein
MSRLVTVAIIPGARLSICQKGHECQFDADMVDDSLAARGQTLSR